MAIGQSSITDLDFADDVSLLAELLELLVIHSDYIQYLTINLRYISVLFRPVYWGLSLSASLYFSKRGAYYGRPLSVSGRPCYILPMFFLNFFYGRLILRPW